MDYPYIEWYSEANGRVVLELEPSQLEVVHGEAATVSEKTPSELVRDRAKTYLGDGHLFIGHGQRASDESRKQDGDGTFPVGLTVEADRGSCPGGWAARISGLPNESILCRGALLVASQD